jgi:hypothetical protein
VFIFTIVIFCAFYPLVLKCLDLVGGIFYAGGLPSMNPIWFLQCLPYNNHLMVVVVFTKNDSLQSSFAFVTTLVDPEKSLTRMSLFAVWSLWTKSITYLCICTAFTLLGFVVEVSTPFVVN